MTLTTLIIINTVLGVLLVSALAQLLLHGVHADRRHRTLRAAEIRELPVHRQGRIAA
jgi:hypothetical protein